MTRSVEFMGFMWLYGVESKETHYFPAILRYVPDDVTNSYPAKKVQSEWQPCHADCKVEKKTGEVLLRIITFNENGDKDGHPAIVSMTVPEFQKFIEASMRAIGETFGTDSNSEE